MEGEDRTMPHVLMVSFPGQGHINPLLRFAKRVAAKGLLVTLCSTDDLAPRIADSTGNSDLAAPAPVGRGFIRLEFFSDGMPCDDPRRKDTNELMTALRAAGPPALAALIRAQAAAGRPVSCVVNNPFIPWVMEVAADAGIPCGLLWVQSCMVFAIYNHYCLAPGDFPDEKNPNVKVSIPGLPPVNPEELPTFLLWNSPFKAVCCEILEQFRNISKAAWVFVNSFEALELEAVQAISARVPILPVGPLVEAEGNSRAATVRGDFYKAADDCEEWLGRQAERSVVYVSVGSVVVLSGAEMEEIAWGLVGCGRPFLWVVRSDARALLPEGFTEEAGERGRVVEWSPQDCVLAHPALGCFVTHCGWNSTLEALAAGVPVVAYPQWGDHMPDAKMLVEECGVGVRLQAPATREEVSRCVKAVTAGEGADAIRARAANWREAATKAVAEGGASDRNIQAFVDEIRTCASGGCINGKV